jgi:DNA-binding transcriptional regulator YhcF (GntR family)
MALLMPRIFSLSIQNYNGEKLNYYIRMFRSYKNKTPDDLWSVCSSLLHDILHESPNLLFESLYVDLLIYAKSSFFTEHRRALSGFYSYSEGHIATSVIESIATKDPAEVFSCFQWMYDTACASIKRYMDDLSVKKPGIPEDNPCEFLWKAEKGRDHYYTQVARDIIDKIGIGIYDEGTFLPSESRLASHYGVSVATIRKALAMVNHLGFAQTFNVKGTQVMLQGDGNAANSMKNKVYKKDTLSYLSGLQLMAIAIRPAALMVFDRLDDSIKQSLSTQPAVPGRNRLDLIVECIIERLHLYPLRDILKETKKMLLWGYYYAFFIENPKLVDTLDDKVLAAVGYLQKGEKANFADQLSLCYLHVLEFVRGFVVGYGLSEAAKLTAT